MCFSRVIDCTGDADIAHMAGAEYRKTGDFVSSRKCISSDILASLRTTRIRIAHNFEQLVFFAAKSEMMGMTTVFNASGVDKEDFVKYTEANPATYRVGIPQLKPPIFVSDTNLQKTGLVTNLGSGDNWEGRRPKKPLPR